jgi:hypothetical protein
MRLSLLSRIACLALLSSSAAAEEKKLAAPLFAEVLMTARAYAADRSLVFYCLRKDDEMRPFLYAAVHLDLAYALQLLRASGADDRQRAELIEMVLGNVRPARREDDDMQQNKNCSADLAKSVAELRGAGLPLFMRPPFDKLKP